MLTDPRTGNGNGNGSEQPAQPAQQESEPTTFPALTPESDPDYIQRGWDPSDDPGYFRKADQE